MLQRIESPPNVLAYRAVGKVEKSDYDAILEPAVAALIAETAEIRFVYVIGDEFDGYSAGATWEDTKFGIGHLSKWKRIAVVTNHDWVRHGVRMFGWMVPGEVKTFPLAEERAAIEWAADPTAPPDS
jgi:SpoIIAA-like